MTEYTSNPVGRPKELTDEVRRKIEEVAALDGTVEEMAYYAGVHRSTLYRWMKENPDLRDRIEELRERPILAARQEIVRGIEGDKDFALRYIERKRPKEFGASHKVEHSGVVGTQQVRNDTEFDKAADAVVKKYEAEMRELYADQSIEESKGLNQEKYEDHGQHTKMETATIEANAASVGGGDVGNG